MLKNLRKYIFFTCLLGWAAGLAPRLLAQELVTEPLTDREEHAESQKTPLAVAVIPTPEYYDYLTKPRRYGDKQKNSPEKNSAPTGEELVTTPLLESEPVTRKQATPVPSPAGEPENKKVISYVSKPGAPQAGQNNFDTQGPVPVKGEDLKTEPLYNSASARLPAAGEGALQAKADLDRNRVHLDESFTLTVDITGRDLGAVALAAPRLKNLDLINTNQAETRISQHGLLLKLRTYHFVYLPLATGTVTIPALEITGGQAKVFTEPLSLEVEGPRSGFAFQRRFSGNRSLVPKMMAAAPDDAGAKTGDEAEFYAQLSRPWVYVNQQVNLTVRFRCQTEIGTKMGYMPPSLEGFISEELPQTQGEAVVSGTRFRTLERVYRTALFPIHAGQLNVGAATAVISQGSKNKTQLADPVTLEVKPLPADSEASGDEANSALVGKFSLEAQSEAVQTVAEGPVRIQFSLKGEGNLKGAPEPQLPRGSGWQWQLEERHLAMQVINEIVQGECIFKYLAIPQKPGKTSPGEARLRYFDPESNRWRTARAKLPIILVAPKQAQISVAAPVLGPAAAEPAKRELWLRPNHGGNRSLRQKRQPLMEANGYWAAHGGGLLLLLGGWLWARRRRTETDVQAVRARRANGEVRKALKQAQQLIARHEVQPFYDSISRATAEYLAAKFGVSVTAIVIERLPEFFERFSIPEDFQSKFKISLTVCEYVRFAAMEFPEQDMRALHADLIRSVEEFEKFWKQRQAQAKKKTPLAGAGLLLVLLAAVCLTAQAGEAELYFLRGNTFAQEGKLEAALAEYQKVISLGVDDPDVYYNLGNMYLRLGQIGRAELAYERGLQLAPRDADLLANLRQATGCVGGEASLDDGWTKASRGWRAYQSFTVSELATLASAFYGLAVLLFFTAWFWRGGASWLRRAGWSLLVPALVLGLWAALRYTEPQWRKRALVLSGEAQVRSRPLAEAEVLFVIPEGTLTKLEREEDEWAEVQLAHNRHGWVLQTSLAKID